MKVATIIHRQIFVSGHVQGVFFRESTKQMAVQLGLTGGVRNLSDGRVEVRVTGEEAVVQTLIKWLKIGPKLAKVSTIEVIDCAVDSLQQKQDIQFDVWPTK